jgi:hypothetical protein
MKCIKVTEFAPPVGKEYDANAYPGEGLFLHPATRALVCVYSPPFSSIGCAVLVGSGTMDYLLEEFPEPVSAPAPSFSEDFILKALAIAQQPQLAVNLLDKPS